MGFFSKLFAAFTPTPYVYPGYAYGKAYSTASGGTIRYIEFWTCKECGELTKVYGKNSGYKCRTKKCPGDRRESVLYWKDREARGLPYEGKTEFVPTPRRDPEAAKLAYHEKRHARVLQQVQRSMDMEKGSNVSVYADDWLIFDLANGTSSDLKGARYHPRWRLS